LSVEDLKHVRFDDKINIMTTKSQSKLKLVQISDKLRYISSSKANDEVF